MTLWTERDRQKGRWIIGSLILNITIKRQRDWPTYTGRKAVNVGWKAGGGHGASIHTGKLVGKLAGRQTRWLACWHPGMLARWQAGTGRLAHWHTGKQARK